MTISNPPDSAEAEKDRGMSDENVKAPRRSYILDLLSSRLSMTPTEISETDVADVVDVDCSGIVGCPSGPVGMTERN